MPDYKTHEQYIEEVSIKNPNVKVIGIYTGCKNKIKHRCLIHNVEWDALPTNILKGRGCCQCKIEKRVEKRTKTHEQYCAEVLEKNPDIIPLEEYKGANISILHKCSIHNIEWEITPSNVLQGMGCQKCRSDKLAKANLITHEEYVDRLYECNPTVVPFETYKGMTTRIKHKCLIHDNIWETTPMSVLQGCGCDICLKEKIAEKNSLTYEEYLCRLSLSNPNIQCLESYINERIPILHKCIKCGFEWKVRPDALLRNHGCPQCNAFISFGEESIKQWLDNHHIQYYPQYRFNNCRDINTLPFDFYLNQLNKCIEYDGKQHYQSIDFYGGEKAFQNRQLHDKIKTEYCEQNNIPLLRIPYYEKDIETQLEQFIFN